MPSNASGHVGVGSGSVALGACLLLAAIIRPAFLTGDFLMTPLWSLALVGGCVLALAGALILLFTWRKPEEPQPEVLAHVAFNSRMIIPDTIPTLPGAPHAAAAAPARAAAAPAARLPQPAQPAQGRVPARSSEILRIDEQIRDLTKKINKAGVMLATGQLSQQGYIAYVDDLKTQRGKLEAQRVRSELNG